MRLVFCQSSGFLRSGEKTTAVDENEFIDAARMLYDGVRDIRRATLMYRPRGDLEAEEEEEDDMGTEDDKEDVVKDEGANNDKEKDATEAGKEVTTIREAIQRLPDTDRQEICRELEVRVASKICILTVLF
jgi:hypothetical protein